MQRSILAAAIVALAVSGCTTLAPQAEHVRITREAADVAACKAVGDVHSTPPYALPNEDYKQLRNAAVALQADTVLVTTRAVISRGVAYQCAHGERAPAG
jgi:hypothetical protein